MHWQEFPDAPDTGTIICPLADVTDNTTTMHAIGDFHLLIVRRGANLHGFVNLCPHQFLPLTHRKADVTSADGSVLLCSNHGMKFDIVTGQGDGCALSLVPFRIEGENLIIA